MYNLCCFYVRRGYCHFTLDDHELNSIWNNQLRKEDITRTYFKCKSADHTFLVNNAVHNSLPLCHLFLVKYLLHVNVSNLIAINQHFLNNQDCMEIIGSFLGIEKEWIVCKKNWYRNHAFEGVHFLHSEGLFDEDGEDDATLVFEQVKDYAAKYSLGEMKTTHYALEVGMRGIVDFGLQERQGNLMSTSRWAALIKSYELNHHFLYTINIRPALHWATKMINTMAGWDAIGMNADPSLCVTEFVTEAIKSCPDREDYLATLFDFIGGGYIDEEDYESFDNKGSFGFAIKACLLIERKLAHCYFHKNKGCNEAEVILDQLPNRKESYICDPPQEHPKGPFYETMESDVSEWLPDVTKVVDALFQKGLATSENLRILFGKSGYLSYRIWELQQRKRNCTHKSMISFVTRKSIWKEGCIGYDSFSGLKIKYLTMAERRVQFEDLRKFTVPLRNTIHDLEPSLEQFETKFGWDNLGVKSEKFFFGSFEDFVGHDNSGGPVTKRHRCGLDEFSTVYEACRHYYDTSSLEVAIWDLVGIPRLIVLNGNRETMQKSGWEYCRGSECVLGDKSVEKDCSFQSLI